MAGWQSEWLVDLGSDESDGEHHNGQDKGQNAHDLEGFGDVSSVVAKDGFSAVGVALGQVDKENDQEVKQELLDEDAPDAREIDIPVIVMSSLASILKVREWPKVSKLPPGDTNV